MFGLKMTQFLLTWLVLKYTNEIIHFGSRYLRRGVPRILFMLPFSLVFLFKTFAIIFIQGISFILNEIG